MIHIDEALDALPHFDKFCSVAELNDLANSLRDDPRFTVEVAGTSANGLPIHHIRFGRGRLKALFAAHVHCMEPIGALTVHDLLTLLKNGHPAVTDADVEWHFVPCADPDGALLNEEWTQKPFTLQSYMKGFHVQGQEDQVDGAFPIDYKNLHFSEPTPEAAVLKGLLDKVRPDFFFSLHNALMAGAFYVITHDIGEEHYRAFRDLLERSGIPLQTRIYHTTYMKPYGEGVLEMGSVTKIYDLIAASGAAPENILKCGGGSWDHLAAIKPEAQCLVAEIPYATHPESTSTAPTSQNMRQLKLRLDAENKYVATVVLEEWEKVKDDLDTKSAFYRKILKGMVEARDNLHEGLPSWPERTRDLLFNPGYSRNVTKGEHYENYMIHYFTVCHAYEFVRLLKASSQTDRVKAAIARLEPIFDAAVADIADNLDAARLRLISHDDMMRAQLGSGLVAINAQLKN